MEEQSGDDEGRRQDRRQHHVEPRIAQDVVAGPGSPVRILYRGIVLAGVIGEQPEHRRHQHHRQYDREQHPGRPPADGDRDGDRQDGEDASAIGMPRWAMDTALPRAAVKPRTMPVIAV